MSTWWERTCRWRRASRCCHAFHGKGLRKCFCTSISSTSLSGVSAGAAAAGACAAVWCSKAAAMTGARSVISSGGGWCQPCPNLRAICIRQSWTLQVPETELERARRAKACCQEFHESGWRNESRRQSCRCRCLARSEGSVLDGHGVCIIGMGVLDSVSDANPSEAAAACGHIQVTELISV